MLTIYIDGSAALESGTAGQLLHLSEGGHDLVLVAPADHPAAGVAPWRRHIPELPDDGDGQAWYVTADPATCGDRRPGIRTILIGPREDGPHPTRCDATARDLF